MKHLPSRWQTGITAILLLANSHLLMSALDPNRLTYLDEFCDPFLPDQDFPKLTTPQWIGEEDVECVVILSIDDMRQHQPYEAFLRPLLDRLKEFYGEAPVSIMTNQVDPAEPHLQFWLQEGLSIETHTIDHPCPILNSGDFFKAKTTYDDCIDLLFDIPGYQPVCFRTPCMDGINAVGPRLYEEILLKTTPQGNFISQSSSVGVVLNSKDREIPREFVLNEKGEERFEKYLPAGYAGYIENYPYPYIVSNRQWEFPFMVPDDYEAQLVNGPKSPSTLTDLKRALDAVVVKQGLMVFGFHPHGWITAEQIIEFLNYSTSTYGKRVRFITFKQAQQRIDQFLLSNQPLRNERGDDNGIRLLDLNHDGWMDVVIGNENLQMTRIWRPSQQDWQETGFPTRIVKESQKNDVRSNGVRFGIVQSNGYASMLVKNEIEQGFHHFDGRKWVTVNGYFKGLEPSIFTSLSGRDRGVRFRDITGDGTTELVISNPDQNFLYEWNPRNRIWSEMTYTIPSGRFIVDGEGLDNGLRFADLNDDGFDDIVFSNSESYSAFLMVSEPYLGFQTGWSRMILNGNHASGSEIPMIIRSGKNRNNGAWFSKNSMWVQNEDTADLPFLVQKISFTDLMKGTTPQPKDVDEALPSFRLAEGFQIQAIAAEPLIKDPVGFDWGLDGRLWVVEMGDYPERTSKQTRRNGRVRWLEDLNSDGVYDRSHLFLDGLNYPTGIMTYRNNEGQDGVLISAAPDILFAYDTTGDGWADRTDVLFTGFGEGNQQHRVNGFEFGLDNWIYCANGDSGGTIRSSKKGEILFDLRGYDFRFFNQSGARAFGQTQFGRRRDDWGNWFGNANPVWLWHYFVDDRFLEYSLGLNRIRKFTAQYPDAGRVRINSIQQQRFNRVGMDGHVTSACSPSPYRGELFGTEYKNSVFISEPANNVIRREILIQNGVSFQSHSDGEKEFLVSNDPWFRPTTLRTGPDGALWVADMYRLYIEHLQWIPQDVESHIDVKSGNDRGRIYRIYPTDKKPGSMPTLLDQISPRPNQGLSPNELKSLLIGLESPNGWQRDKSQLLLGKGLRHSEFKVRETLLNRLQTLVESHPNAKVRLQALCTLDGIHLYGEADAPPTETIILMPIWKRLEHSARKALQDPNHYLRKHAVRIASDLLNKRSIQDQSSRSLMNELLERTSDSSAKVRFQLALELHRLKPSEAVSAARTRLILKDFDQPEIMATATASGSFDASELIIQLLGEFNTPTERNHWVTRLSSKLDRDQKLQLVSSRFQEFQKMQSKKEQAALLEFIASVLEADSMSSPKESNQQTTKDKVLLKKINRVAEETLTDGADGNEPLLIAGIRILGASNQMQEPSVKRLLELADSNDSMPVRKAAWNSLTKHKNASIGTLILEKLTHYTQGQVETRLLLLTRRSDWTKLLLADIRNGTLKKDQLSPAVMAALLQHPSMPLREISRDLLVNADQQNNQDSKVETLFRKLQGKEGNAGRGLKHFELYCSSCHRNGKFGQGAGPDLAGSRNKDTKLLLESIVTPNKAVEEKYKTRLITTLDNDFYSGWLAEETTDRVSLSLSTGETIVIPKNRIHSFESSEMSMMPEGFGEILSPTIIADLLVFIKNPPPL